MKTTYAGVTKTNLVRQYHLARTEAMKETTITAAFKKTGIVPFNPDIFPEEIFAPAQLTTTSSAQIVTMDVPSWLEAVEPTNPRTPRSVSQRQSRSVFRTPSHSRSPSPTATSPLHFPSSPSSSSSGSRSGDDKDQRSSSPQSVDDSDDESTGDPPPASDANAKDSVVEYRIVGLPLRPKGNASRESMQGTIATLYEIVERAKFQIERDMAAKILMNIENERLRRVIFGRRDSKKARAEVSGKARHMTAEENIQALAEYDWAFKMRAVFGELKLVVRARTKKRKVAENQKKAAEKELERQQKEIEKEAEKAQKEAEKAEKEAERERKKREKEIEKEIEKVRKEEEKRQRDEEKAEAKRVDKEQKEAERLRKAEAKKREKAEQKRLAVEAKAAAPPAKRGRKRKELTDDTTADQSQAAKRTRVSPPQIPPNQLLPASNVRPPSPNVLPTMRGPDGEPPEGESRDWNDEMMVDPLLRGVGISSAYPV